MLGVIGGDLINVSSYDLFASYSSSKFPSVVTGDEFNVSVMLEDLADFSDVLGFYFISFA